MSIKDNIEHKKNWLEELSSGNRSTKVIHWDYYGQVKAWKPTNKGNAQLTFSGCKKEIEVSFV